MEFETRPVSEITTRKGRGRNQSAWVAHLLALPEGVAMFIPRGDRKVKKLTTFAAMLRSVVRPHAKVTISVDEQKDGVWIWRA